MSPLIIRSINLSILRRSLSIFNRFILQGSEILTGSGIGLDTQLPTPHIFLVLRLLYRRDSFDLILSFNDANLIFLTRIITQYIDNRLWILFRWYFELSFDLRRLPGHLGSLFKNLCSSFGRPTLLWLSINSVHLITLTNNIVNIRSVQTKSKKGIFRRKNYIISRS